MADDAIRQIIDAAKFIVTGLAGTGGKVFEDLSQALAEDQVPGIVVEPITDTVTIEAEVLDSEEWIDKHALRLRFTAIGRSPLERDTVGLEIKRAVIPSQKLGRFRRYVGSRYPRSGEGRRDYFAAEIEFDLVFYTENTSPDAVLFELPD